MKEHEDCDMNRIEKASVIVDSTVLEEIVTEEGKTEGVLGGRDEGEDMMVDVVGADAVDLDGKADSVRLVEECMQKETESHDLNMDVKEEVAGSGEEDVCHDSIGSSVSTVEKVEVRDCEMGFESRGESQIGGGDIAGIDGKELTERGLIVEQCVESVEDCLQKETEIRDLNMDTKQVAGSGEEDVCHDSVGSGVLAFEKVEVTVNEEGLKTSIEVRECEMGFESKGEPQFGGGDITGKEQMERGSTVEQHVESVEECMQKETETHDLNVDMEEAAASGEDVCRDSAGSGVAAFEKVEVTVIEEGLNTSLEVSKDVLQGNDATACGSLVQDSKESSIGGGNIVVIDNKDLTDRGSTEEVVEQHVESVEEVGDGDRVMDGKTKKEAETVDSSKIEESLATTTNLCSQEVDMIVVEDGFASKDEAKDGVSVDPSLVSANNQDSSTELVNVGTDEVDGRSKEDCMHPINEIITDDSQGNASRETRFVGGENDLIDREVELDRGLAKEIMEQPIECDQQVGNEDCVVDEKIGKESEDLDSTKIPEPSTTTNPGSEDVDVVVVEEGLASKDEAQDGVSVDPSLVCADNRSLPTKVVNSATSEGDVIAQAENVDQQAEVISHGARNLENGTGVGDSKSAVDSSSGEPQFGGETAVIDIEETEKGLTAEEKEIVEQHPESVQKVIHGDGVMDEKTRKEDEVLDSSKIPESLIATNLGPEEVLTMKNVAQDSDSVGQRLVYPDNQSLSTENSDPRAEIDTTSKDESVHPTVEITACTGVDQGIKAGDASRCSINDAAVCVKPSNEVPTSAEMNGFQVSADAFEEVNGVTPCADVVKHCVVHEDSGFSYEDAHMERGEDAGMDIDEVLGWKDEMPGIDVLSGHQEKDQHDKINADSEGGNIVNNVVSFKKRKFLDPISDGSEKKPNLNLEKVATALISTPKPSFKVGECIQRVATQLTGPPLVLKSDNDPNGQRVDQLVGPENSQMERMIVESKQSSVDEMLSQLQLVAQDPMKGHTFLNTIKPFFYDHRAVGRPVSVRKRKTSNENEAEEFEFDDVNDSYWTDRIIQNHSEEQLLQDNQNGGQEHHVVVSEPDKPAKANRRSNKKRFLFSNHEMGLKEQSELVERRRQNLATEVVLKFPEGIYFPSEIHLNKMFRRFGALMESETEVDRQNGRARVVFKKCCDAEVAHSSAGKFNIFGPINVNYELNYNPLVSYKPLPLSLLQEDSMDAS
ncbi:uncharacterized protein LOC112501206 [Cynara cardunculus var. scolymus]|uniref:uncharacterized protein LOC112501206 n=1 Tax=Cynara cardunculus var. scolymus TaxID=59895 RepID=UPI000D630958|nr:uncharacterized protein LOC112501206 [Cynara cardunculus var. scolymus]XP_024960664.1 uncharacterized protein LOC112501206 [Cynara cardunculus var. scolymus]